MTHLQCVVPDPASACAWRAPPRGVDGPRLSGPSAPMTRSAAIRLTWSAAGVEHGQERGAPFTHRCGRGGRFLGLGRWERCDEPLPPARLHRLGPRRPHHRQHGTPRSGLTDSERRRLGERSEHLPSGFLWPPLDCDANAGGLPHNGGSPGGTTQSSHRFSQTLRYEPSARRWPRTRAS